MSFTSSVQELSLHLSWNQRTAIGLLMCSLWYHLSPLMSHYVLNFLSLTDLLKKQNILNFGEWLFMLLCSVRYATVSEPSDGARVLQSWQAVLRFWVQPVHRPQVLASDVT